MKKRGWKTLAIIFIAIFILETAFIAYAITLASEMTRQENECIINTCDGYDSFYYDINSEICYCFEDDEVKVQEYLG